MRRAVIAMVVVLSLPAGSGSLAAPPEVPFLPRPCAPEGPLDQARPPECQRILYKLGPLQVTPGDNLILLGPVTIERPMQDGFVVRFKPNLERVDGTIPGIEVLHLHHAVWFSTAFSDPIFASGEEKTIFSMPNGYGIPVRATGELWLLNYMLHNQTPIPDDVFVTYEIDFIPKAQVPAGSIKEVEPYWIDVGSFNGFNPVYNTQRGYGTIAPGECAFPKEQCAAFDPYGETVTGNGRPGNGLGHQVSPPSGTIVWMMGHVHPGGLRTDLEMLRGGVRKRVFTSDAIYFDPNGPVSWDMSMEVTRPEYRLRIQPGDRLILNSVYDSARASWYEGMGIVITFVARNDTTGRDPFGDPSFDPDDTAITHGHMPEAANHGGPDRDPLPEATPVRTNTVGIGAFTYAPGTLGVPVVATVPRGTPLTFVNLDAPAQVFHTVTACAAPCNGATGISYPLANGPVDFDSLELGYGPPGATAASNRGSYALPTSSMTPGTYTYFCRVHPFMRGAFAVE